MDYTYIDQVGDSSCDTAPGCHWCVSHIQMDGQEMQNLKAKRL